MLPVCQGLHEWHELYAWASNDPRLLKRQIKKLPAPENKYLLTKLKLPLVSSLRDLSNVVMTPRIAAIPP
jgi:hypothetical protein